MIRINEAISIVEGVINALVKDGTDHKLVDCYRRTLAKLVQQRADGVAFVPYIATAPMPEEK